ncbi:hypothetical protein F0562_012110 [Nyssa sinensis]|uniref:Uncharacterized protein n=1 Tax=Nyssa sinensis TaxID=561372 RepID=A0A5J4ZWH3_9ASTE|nr:hypothetical protein F0562_012110 [Nyssa sinensis]
MGWIRWSTVVQWWCVAEWRESNRYRQGGDGLAMGIGSVVLTWMELIRLWSKTAIAVRQFDQVPSQGMLRAGAVLNEREQVGFVGPILSEFRNDGFNYIGNGMSMRILVPWNCSKAEMLMPG